MPPKKKQAKKKMTEDSFIQEEDGEFEQEETKIEDPATTKFSLYDILGVKKNATADEIKKAYRRLALQHHPDKNLGDDSTAAFQKINEAYQILSNEERRRVYDDTGDLGENGDINDFRSAWTFTQRMFRRLEKEDIDAFEKKYRGSALEQEDLRDFYVKNKGKITLLVETIPLSRNEDIPRFIEYFEQAIADGTLSEYKAFETTKNKVKRLPETKERSEPPSHSEEAQMKDLQLAIRGRQNHFGNFLSNIEAKYGGKDSKKSQKKRLEPELSDADFEALQAKMFGKGKKASKKNE